MVNAGFVRCCSDLIICVMKPKLGPVVPACRGSSDHLSCTKPPLRVLSLCSTSRFCQAPQHSILSRGFAQFPAHYLGPRLSVGKFYLFDLCIVYEAYPIMPVVPCVPVPDHFYGGGYDPHILSQESREPTMNLFNSFSPAIVSFLILTSGSMRIRVAP